MCCCRLLCRCSLCGCGRNGRRCCRREWHGSGRRAPLVAAAGRPVDRCAARRRTTREHRHRRGGHRAGAAHSATTTTGKRARSRWRRHNEDGEQKTERRARDWARGRKRRCKYTVAGVHRGQSPPSLPPLAPLLFLRVRAACCCRADPNTKPAACTLEATNIGRVSHDQTSAATRPPPIQLSLKFDGQSIWSISLLDVDQAEKGTVGLQERLCALTIDSHCKR